MSKELENKEKIKRITQFISDNINCNDCPATDACWKLRNTPCEEIVSDYLMGNNENGIKQMLMDAIVGYFENH